MKKRFLRLPIVLVVSLLILTLSAGVAFAAYNFLSFSTVVAVAEPMTGEYNLNGKYGGDSEWHSLGDEDSLTIEGSAGDVFDLTLRFSNYASNPLTISTVITGGGGNVEGIGFPDGAVIPGDPSDWVEFPVSVIIAGDAAPGSYTVNFAFTRE